MADGGSSPPPLLYSLNQGHYSWTSCELGCRALFDDFESMLSSVSSERVT